VSFAQLGMVASRFDYKLWSEVLASHRSGGEGLTRWVAVALNTGP